MILRTSSILALLVILFCYNLTAQEGGKVVTGENKRQLPDTVIRFISPRPLLEPEIGENVKSKFFGLNLILSNNGFGFGGYFEYSFTNDFSAFASLYLSGARNTDEFEYYDPYSGQIFIPGKINRLYMFPLTIGINRFVLSNVLNSNFYPYFSFGFGPTFILSTPYKKEFFTSFAYSKFYVRFGGFVGFGVNVPTTTKSYFGVSARYYWIPFGGNGLESIIDMPIKDFGGFFLGFNLGIKI